jgi:RNA polymerase sigma-70 factor (ECF subfamily)
MNARTSSLAALAVGSEPDVSIDPEQDLICRWKRGEKQAFEALVKRHMADAFYVAYGYVGNAEDARDLSQEAFVKAYQARASFDEGRPFYPWFYRIIKNHCLNFVTRRHRHVSLDDENEHREIPSPAASPLEDLEESERKRLVRAALDRLSEDHREIIVLKDFKDHSYREIADILGIPIGTVMSRLYYARQTLRATIEEIEREGIPAQSRSREVG